MSGAPATQNGECGEHNDARAALTVRVFNGQVVTILGLPAKTCKRLVDGYYTALGFKTLIQQRSAA